MAKGKGQRDNGRRLVAGEAVLRPGGGNEASMSVKDPERDA